MDERPPQCKEIHLWWNADDPEAPIFYWSPHWPSVPRHRLALNDVLDRIERLWDARRKLPLCIDERILCGEPVVDAYRVPESASAVRGYREAFAKIRGALLRHVPQGYVGETDLKQRRHSTSVQQLAFSRVRLAIPPKHAPPAPPDPSETPSSWPTTNTQVDSRPSRLDAWYLKASFAELRKRLLSWPKLTACYSLEEPLADMSAFAHGTPRVSLIEPPSISLDSGCIATHRVYATTLAPSSRLVPPSERASYNARVLKDNDILLSLARLNDVKIGLYKQQPAASTRDPAEVKADDTDAAVAGDDVYILRPHAPVPEAASGPEALEVLRSEELLNQLRMHLSDRIELPLHTTHITNLRLPPVADMKEPPCPSPDLKFLLAEIAAVRTPDLSDRLVRLSDFLASLPNNPQVPEEHLPPSYAILKHNNMNPDRKDSAALTRHGPEGLRHVPGVRLQWILKRYSALLPSSKQETVPELQSAVLADSDAIASTFSDTFLRQWLHVTSDFHTIETVCASAATRLHFWRQLHRYDLVFVILPDANPFGFSAVTSLLRRLISLIGQRCFIILDAQSTPAATSQHSLVRRVLVDEGPLLQLQRWQKDSTTINSLRLCLDACRDMGAALRRAIRHVATFAAELDRIRAGNRPSSPWRGMSDFSRLIAERLERELLEDEVPLEADKIVPQPKKRRAGSPAAGNWLSKPRTFTCGRQRFVTYDKQLAERIEEYFVHFKASDRAFLIEGPSGSGKCLVARHYCQEFLGKDPLVANLYGPREVMDSTLFGHVKGAFTGALNDTLGYLGRAKEDRVPLIVNEANSLTPDVQLKLLEVLNSGKYEKVGGNKIEYFDQMIIFAANVPLRDECMTRGADGNTKGTVRLDFIQRLGPPLRLPPLRTESPAPDRSEECSRLLEHFLSERSAIECVATPQFDDAAHTYLVTKYHWPGNVRELEMVVRNLVRGKIGDDRPIGLSTVLDRCPPKSEPTLVNEPGDAPTGRSPNLDLLRRWNALLKTHHFCAATRKIFPKSKGNEARVLAKHAQAVEQHKTELTLLYAQHLLSEARPPRGGGK